MSRFAKLSLNVDKPYRMSIIYPGQADPLTDKDGKEAYLDLLSPDSEVGRKLERKIQKDVLELVRVSGKADDYDEIAERLAGLTMGWHLVGLDGEAIEVPHSHEAALELYRSPDMAWLRRRAWARVTNEANFTKSSSES